MLFLWVLLSFWIFLFLFVVCEDLHHKFVRSKKMLPLAGKAVLITGCDSGFGRITAIKLHTLGVKVFAGCYSKDAVKNLQQEVAGVEVFEMDVTNRDHVLAAVKRVEAAGLPLWALINNAGIGISAPIDWCTESMYRQMTEVNFFAMVFVTKAFLSLLKRSRGRVVNLASVAGSISVANGSAYCATKHAVEAFSDALRREMKPFGVSVAIIEPGWFRTPLVQNSEPLFRKHYSEAPEEIRTQYGDAYVEGCVAIAKDAYKNGSEPSLVRDVLIEATFSASPRVRYRVGIDSKTIYRVLTWLPSRLQDRVVEILPGGTPPKPKGALY